MSIEVRGGLRAAASPGEIVPAAAAASSEDGAVMLFEDDDPCTARFRFRRLLAFLRWEYCCDKIYGVYAPMETLSLSLSLSLSLWNGRRGIKTLLFFLHQKKFSLFLLDSPVGVTDRLLFD